MDERTRGAGWNREESGCSRRALERLRRESAKTMLRELTSASEAKESLERAELIVDAVVGTGFKPPLRGLAAEVGGLLRQAHAQVVAVDLPSGCDADSTAKDAVEAYRSGLRERSRVSRRSRS